MSNDERRQRSESGEQRRERLAAELRTNLVKRKAQARARKRAAADDGIPEEGGDRAPRDEPS